MEKGAAITTKNLVSFTHRGENWRKILENHENSTFFLVSPYFSSFFNHVSFSIHPTLITRIHRFYQNNTIFILHMHRRKLHINNKKNWIYFKLYIKCVHKFHYYESVSYSQRICFGFVRKKITDIRSQAKQKLAYLYFHS